VGGVPGIALGAAVLVLGAVLGLTNAVPEAWRGPLLLVAALGAIGFGVLVLRGGSQVADTKGDRSRPAMRARAARANGRQRTGRMPRPEINSSDPLLHRAVRPKRANQRRK
jgi:hypothetical protein